MFLGLKLLEQSTLSEYKQKYKSKNYNRNTNIGIKIFFDQLRLFTDSGALVNHIFEGVLTEEIAKQISKSRNYSWPSWTRRNTVFEKPTEFNFYETDDYYYPLLIISCQRVKTFCCTKKSPSQNWESEFLGLNHAIFDIDLNYVGHFFNNGDIDFQI